MAAGLRSAVFMEKWVSRGCWMGAKANLPCSIAAKAFSSQSEPAVSTAPAAVELDDMIKPPNVDPLKHPDFFGVRNFFTVKDLFDARVHLGHREGSLNDHMRPFLYGSRLGYLVFDLDQTAKFLRAALNFIAHVSFRKGIILFVNRNAQTSHLVERLARECGEYAHTRQWTGGVLTNATLQFGSITRLPDVIVLLNVLSSVLELHDAVTSAAKMLIPTVGIVDTNCDPTLVTYPVPGNDDTPVAVHLYCDLIKRAVLIGKQKRREMEDEGLIGKHD